MKRELVSIPTKIPGPIVDQVDFLVKEGLFTSRSEFIREAVRDFLADEVERMQPHRTAFTVIQKELMGKVRAKSVEEITDETRRIRQELLEKRK